MPGNSGTPVALLSHRDIISHVAQRDPDPSLEPINPQKAKQLFGRIVANGTVVFSRHAQDEMAKDDLQTTDCLNMLRAGLVESPEYIKGQWRYRVGTQRMTFVVTFVSKTRLLVVTAWRNGQ